MEIIKLTAIGFVLGITAVIPGFSVATMAFVFNVYDRLINVIVPDIKKILAAWKFWLPLVIGGFAGIIFFSIAFSKLMENYSIPTYWFFIGVITGSIPLIFSKAGKLSDKKGFISYLPAVICFILAVAVMIILTVNKPEEGNVIYSELTLPLFGILTLAGMLAAIAMIIPGISGAFVLLVMGLFLTITEAVRHMNFIMLIPVVLGACAGLLLGAAFVRFLLLKVPRETYGAVLGLVVGSIFVLYPGSFAFQARWGDLNSFGGEGIGIVISIVCLLTGFTLSFIMSRNEKSNMRDVGRR